MESFTSLRLLASLLFCLLQALQPSQAVWVKIEGLHDDEGGVLREWRESRQDDIEVEEAFQFYTTTLRMTRTSPGKYRCTAGDHFLLMSQNHPDSYPPNAKMKWIIKSDRNSYIRIHCPRIRILRSKKCKMDKLVVFTGKKFRKGVRRCGRINNYSWQTDDKIKVTFKSNGVGTSKGFMCTINCVAYPSTTTVTSTSTTSTSTSTTSTSTTTTASSTTSTSSTTTTFSPGCPQPAFPPSVPTSVSTCSDLDPVYSSNCDCTDCTGKISLTCTICTRCDVDIFAVHDFSVNVVLEPHFSCPEDTLDLSGYFFHNADSITALRICLNEDMSHITFPYAELVNLDTLAYQDCTTDLIDLCTSSRRRSAPTPDKKSALIPSTRTTYTFTLPAEADIPNVVNLYLHDVDETLTSSILSCPGLTFLEVDSEDVEIAANAFSNLVNIEHLSVTMCQTTLQSDSFRVSATYLDYLEINDVCVHTIDDDSIIFEDLGRRMSDRSYNADSILVSVTASASFFDHIPMCPFIALLELNCVHLMWNTEVLCRSCGGLWFWDQPSSGTENVTATCYDTVSESSMDLLDYVNTYGKPCPFTLSYTGCS